MSEWEVTQLKNLLEDIIDCEHKTPRFVASSDFFVCRTPNVRGGAIIFDDAKYTDAKGFKEWTQRRLPKFGDILFTREAPAGEIALVPADMKLCMGQRMVLLVPDTSKVVPKFLVHYFYGSRMRRVFAESTIGTTVSRINIADIRELEIQLPSLAEQRAIANALSDMDALIAGLDSLIAKKREMKQAVMQQLLTGKVRLPRFSGDWITCLIKDIADVKTGPFGSSLHERDYVLDGTPIITVEHLGEYGVSHLNLPKVSESDRKRLKAYELESNDIVFSRVGSVDRNALIRPSEAGWLFSGRLLRVRLDPRATYAPFISFYFNTEPFKQRVRGVAVGQTMASLNTQILKGIAICIPTLSEQKALAEVFSDIDSELCALERQRIKTRALKQGMMQDLLTGKTRLI